MKIEEIEKTNELLKPEELTCNMILTIFLYKSSKFVNKRFFMILFIFIKYLRRCINEHVKDQIIIYEGKSNIFLIELKVDF